MDAAADAGRGIVELAGIGFGERDQLLDGFGRGIDGLTSTTSALVPIRPTGAKSLRGS